jgi:hypothetical protein
LPQGEAAALERDYRLNTQVCGNRSIQQTYRQKPWVVIYKGFGLRKTFVKIKDRLSRRFVIKIARQGIYR